MTINKKKDSVRLITSVIVNFYSEIKKRPDDDEDL